MDIHTAVSPCIHVSVSLSATITHQSQCPFILHCLFVCPSVDLSLSLLVCTVIHLSLSPSDYVRRFVCPPSLFHHSPHNRHSVLPSIVRSHPFTDPKFQNKVPPLIFSEFHLTFSALSDSCNSRPPSQLPTVHACFKSSHCLYAYV